MAKLKMPETCALCGGHFYDSQEITYIRTGKVKAIKFDFAPEFNYLEPKFSGSHSGIAVCASCVAEKLAIISALL